MASRKSRIGCACETDRRGSRVSELHFLMIPGAPTSVAPFSHAVEVDGWVFLTGQMPTDPGDDAAPLPAGIEAQSRRVLVNLILVLRGVGLRLENVVAARAFFEMRKPRWAGE